MKHLLHLVFIFGFGSLFAQPIAVSTTQTPQQLVDNVLLGFGVTAFNVTINGNPALANSTNQMLLTLLMPMLLSL